MSGGGRESGVINVGTYHLNTADPHVSTDLLKPSNKRTKKDSALRQNGYVAWVPVGKRYRFDNGSNYPTSNIDLQDYEVMPEQGKLEPLGVSNASGEQPGKPQHTVAFSGGINTWHTGRIEDYISRMDPVYVTVARPEVNEGGQGPDSSDFKGQLGARRMQAKEIQEGFLNHFSYPYNPATAARHDAKIKIRGNGIVKATRLKPCNVFRIISKTIFGNKAGNLITGVLKEIKAPLVNYATSRNWSETDIFRTFSSENVTRADKKPITEGLGAAAAELVALITAGGFA